VLHLQLLGRDPLNPTVIAERVLFEDQVAPLDIQGVAFQNQLFTLRGQQARMVRGGDHGNRRNNDANGSFPNRRRSSPITPGKAWRSLLPIDPLTLLKASVTLPIMRSSSLQYAALNYGHVDSLPPLLRPASTCLVLVTHGRPVF